MSVVNQAIEDAVVEDRIADLIVPMERPNERPVPGWSAVLVLLMEN